MNLGVIVASRFLVFSPQVPYNGSGFPTRPRQNREQSREAVEHHEEPAGPCAAVGWAGPGNPLLEARGRRARGVDPGLGRLIANTQSRATHDCVQQRSAEEAEGQKKRKNSAHPDPTRHPTQPGRADDGLSCVLIRGAESGAVTRRKVE